MRPSLPWATPRNLAAAVILAGFAATLALDWPGHLSYDSILQLQQGRAGLYNNWHPPVMAWLLGLGDAVFPGAGLFVLFQMLLAFGALLALTRLAPARGSWLAAIAALAIILSPQALLYQGLVWKDVLFADAAVAGFVALACAAAHWSHTRLRIAGLAASFLLLALAALTRQNGAILLPIAAAAAGWIAARHGTQTRIAAALGAAGLIASVAFIVGANALLNLRSDGNEGPKEQIRLLEAYDIAGAMVRDPSLHLTAMDDDLSDLDTVLRTHSVRLYTPVRNDTMMADADLQAALDDADLTPAELELIRDHTWTYLKVRAADFAWVFATPDIAACRPVFTGIEGPAAPLQALRIAPRRDARDRALDTYGKAFFGTPVFSHIVFAILAALALFLLLRRRRPADIALAAMLAGSLAFTASFFAISIACDYRYLYALDLSALAALLYLACDAQSFIKGTS